MPPHQAMTAATPKHKAMRCSTPMMRNESASRTTRSPTSSHRTNGAAFRKSPTPKITRQRCRIRRVNAAVDSTRRVGRVNAKEAPTTNRKNGNTRSVGVQPCQGAWASGA